MDSEKEHIATTTEIKLVKKGRPRKYKTAEEAEEARRQKSSQYYKNNREKCIKKSIECRMNRRLLEKQQVN